MCYDSDARPPSPPGATGGATGEDMELASEDGNHFCAFAAHPGGPATQAQVVIFPDVRGLHRFYKELALRFAEKGIEAIAIDYFGRTAGIGSRDDSFDFTSHVPHLTLPTFLADVRAALAYLRNAGSPGAGRAAFTVGFCMGGSLSLLAGAEDLDLAGVIAFYSGFRREFAGSQGSTLDRTRNIRVPVLGLYGGADQGIPPSDLQKLDENLGKAGVEHEIVVYPGAPHSFFDRKAIEFADASADAWERVLGFIGKHSEKTR